MSKTQKVLYISGAIFIVFILIGIISANVLG